MLIGILKFGGKHSHQKFLHLSNQFKQKNFASKGINNFLNLETNFLHMVKS